MVNCTKIGGRSSAIRAASRLEGPADNCWNVSRHRFELTQKITAQFQIRVLF
ncbi:hypothetical protein [Lactiplantibacillus pentosus]|uniref:hypothetical protein n=1 Tax=Lactiplantibacillus pentosus TaxID=1589 RepID=UPI0021A6A0BD|nr:hypothetical protein [Lactiplantibacillus pentosus]